MGQKAVIPATTVAVVNSKGLFTTQWYRYLHALWQRTGGGDIFSLGGSLSVMPTTAGCVSTTATDLLSYSLPANAMHNNGDMLEITAFGTYANNANNKTIILSFGGVTVFTTGAIAAQASSWQINCTIIRETSAKQRVSVAFAGDSSGTLTARSTFTATTKDLTTELVIKCSATGGASNDIVQQALAIKLFPAY